MNWPLGQIAILLCAGITVSVESIAAQSGPDAIQDGTACPLSNTEDQVPTGPEISITEVGFAGSLQISPSDQGEIAHSISENSHGSSFDGLVEDALEKARAGWQDRGYFRVQLTGDARMLTSSSTNQHLALNVQVLDEGARYNLAHIGFRNNTAINSAALRGLFRIKDGEIFSREKIATGLEHLRKAYWQVGYINFTAIPETTFDNEANVISLLIDVDEGMPFVLTRVDVLGLDEATREDILKDAPVKQIYNQRLFELFLEKHAPTLKIAHDDPRRIARKLDEKLGTVEVFLDARSCPADSN